MKKILIIILTFFVLTLSFASCSDGNTVKNYVARNGETIERMMEVSFGEIGDCKISSKGNDIVMRFLIYGTNDASAEFKAELKEVYEGLVPQMRDSFKYIKDELPGLENIIYEVCEEDGDVMCTVIIDF